MTDEDGSEVEEYTRFRANIQLGDGPDQRGDVTVEMQREATDDRVEREVRVPSSQADRDAEVLTTAKCNDAQFAEFYNELMRGRAALSDALGLEHGDD